MSVAPTLDITGRGVLVTGGNDGLGLATARGLAAAGAAVAIWGSNPDCNATAVEQAKDDGLILHAVVCDVRNEDAVAAAFDETVATVGPVRACFANAGSTASGPASST